MLFVGLLVFAAAEVAAFVVVGFQIGFLWAVVALVAASALGPVIVWRVGLGVLGRARQKLAQGELPTQGLLDGVVLLGAGGLICVPGFLGDAVGLLLLLRPLRHLVIRFAGQRLAKRVRAFGAGRWTVVNVSSRPSGADPPASAPSPPIGPGGRAQD